MQKIIPAILTNDPEDLRAKLEILKGHTEWVQIDIMDGKFVENTSVSILALEQACKDFQVEIHLMVMKPGQYLADCAAIGAKRVLFHFEGSEQPKTVLRKMGKYPFEKGIAASPPTHVSELEYYVGEADSILILGVNPGFQGQEFISSMLEKIKEVRNYSSEILIGVDGGVKEENIHEIFMARVDYVVVGSGIFATPDPLATFRKLEGMVQ